MGFVDSLKGAYTDEELVEYANTIVNTFKEQCMKYKSDNVFCNKEEIINSRDTKEQDNGKSKKSKHTKKNINSRKYKYNISDLYEYDINKIIEFVRLELEKEKFDYLNVYAENGCDEETLSKGNDTLGIIIDARWKSAKRKIAKNQTLSRTFNTAVIYEAIALLILFLILIVFIKNTIASFL